MNLLLRIDEMRALETRARSDLPAGTLMQRAGQGAADRIHGGLAMAPGGRPQDADVLVLCGPGDNGGDGFVCAQALRRYGYRVVCWAPLPSASPDAARARAAWAQGERDAGATSAPAAGGGRTDAEPGRTLTQLPRDRHFDLVVDAVLGIGAQRALAAPFLDALHWVRDRRWPVIALDVPSGLHADTGAWIGGVSGAPALHTITFLADKPGLHTGDGVQAAGTVHVDDLGVASLRDSLGAPGRLNDPGRFGSLVEPRRNDSNKGDYGSVAVIGGAAGMVGAVLLAGRAALRLGAGKVFVDCIGAPELGVDLLQPELMFRAEAELPAVDVVVAGCGMGSDAGTGARLERILELDGPLVLDADALNRLALDGALATRVAQRKGTTVLTPHPGEAARLLSTHTRAIQQDRVGCALRIAQRLQSVVVLKGAGSVIAEPSGRYTINPTGGPALATPGTGDVLSGMIGALLAQSRRGQDEDVCAVLAGVWLHGCAAQRFGADVGLTASEVAPLAAQALAALRRAAT
jgi:hydroxyethylthiazole kinase-like uncharacterized protein yjeF